jgi:3-oxoacyl-[acyl-carrier protein] reductase
VTGRTVIVTGGTKGIGKGIAGVFAGAGANVVVAGRDAATGKAAAADLGATFVAADVSKATDCERLAAETIERFGGIDVLCANAGIFPDTKLANMTEEDIDAIFAVNVKGTMLSVKACLDALERSGHGRVVVTSSITGPITGFPGWSQRRGGLHHRPDDRRRRRPGAARVPGGAGVAERSAVSLALDPRATRAHAHAARGVPRS